VNAPHYYFTFVVLIVDSGEPNPKVE